MKLKKIISVFFTLSFLLLLSSDALAAGMGMGGGPPNPCGGAFFPPCPVPLDNNIILLLIAGAAYGGYRIYHSLKKNPA